MSTTVQRFARRRSLPRVTMRRENLEKALHLAIELRRQQDRAEGLLVDSFLVEEFKSILRSSMSGHPIVIED